MDRSGLSGARILVAEDEYTIAMFLSDYLRDQGVEVIGPAGDLQNVTRLIDGQQVDAALLDINLGGELVYPAADRLEAAGVPFLLTSGYDDNVPARFAQRPRCSKPYRLEALSQALQAMLVRASDTDAR